MLSLAQLWKGTASQTAGFAAKLRDYTSGLRKREGQLRKGTASQAAEKPPVWGGAALPALR